MKQGPCWECPERTPGCHGSCPRYQEWKAPLEKMREEKIKGRIADGALIDGTKKRNRQWLRKKGAWTK